MQQIYSEDELDYSMMLDPGLVKWRERAWSLRARHFEYVSESRSAARLRAILFFDKRGNLRQPPLDPYLSIQFDTESTPGTPRRERQWLDVAAKFASDIKKFKLQGSANLPPGFRDARPFNLAGLSVAPRYTYLGKLPLTANVAEPAIRKRISKSVRQGYQFSKDVTSEELTALLDNTGLRQGFNYRITSEKLNLLEELVPPSLYRKHVVRSAEGLAVSAGARLVTQDGVALDWIQGTDREALADGAVQLMYEGVLVDLCEQGAGFFDFGGANIPAVARAKSSWGLPLVSYFQISRNTFKHFALQSSRLRNLAVALRR